MYIDENAFPTYLIFTLKRKSIQVGRGRVWMLNLEKEEIKHRKKKVPAGIELVSMMNFRR